MDEKKAYNLGWNASKTTKTYNLDKAESRFMAKNGQEFGASFAYGWIDYASDYEHKYEKDAN